MAQPYRVNIPGGIKIEATGQIIYPGDPEWLTYEAWLAEQPGPEFPGGPLPPGTGLLPFEEITNTLPEMRAEMLAQLDAMVTDRRRVGVVNAVGHTWKITEAFLDALAIHAAAFPPVPMGFTLPNAARVQVPLNNAEFESLIVAVSDRLIAVNTVYSAFVTAINASATPLGIDLNAGWPT